MSKQKFVEVGLEVLVLICILVVVWGSVGLANNIATWAENIEASITKMADCQCNDEPDWPISQESKGDKNDE